MRTATVVLRRVRIRSCLSRLDSLSMASLQKGVGKLGESITAFGARHVARQMRHDGLVGHDIGDADRVRKEGEHRRIIGAVASIDDVPALAVGVYTETILEHAPGHAELVVLP